MKVEDNHYKYRIETKDSNGSVIDFVDIDTVEPLRCAHDVQDELNLETNEHIKRVEEIILNADSTEFWYVDEDRSTDTHLVCYFEEVQLMANANHPMVDTDRSLFEYGKINANEYQDTNFICTHVMPNGVSRIYMSIDKDQLLYQVFTNETIKEYIAQNPITIWYAIRYPVSIPRSMSKGHLLTLDGRTDVSISTNGKEVGLPIVKFNIGDTQHTLDSNPIHINNTQEGAQIRNIVLEGNTPINYARGNGVNTTEQVSNTRYDFAPFYDGQTTIQGTVEGGYVSAKLYGDTMVNIAKPYGETPLLTATNESALCDDLLGMNEEGVVLADGEITEGRIYGDSFKMGKPIFKQGNLLETNGEVDPSRTDNICTDMMEVPSRAFTFYTNRSYNKIAYYDANGSFIQCQMSNIQVSANIPSNAKYIRYGTYASGNNSENVFTWKYKDGTDVYDTIRSVVNPNIRMVNNNLVDPSLFRKGINITLMDGGVMVDGNVNVGWQSFYNNTTAIKLLANHTYKLRAFLLEGEYTGGNFKYSLSNNTAKEAPYTNTFTITPTTDAYLTALSFYAPSGVGAKFGISLIETTNDLDTYIPYKSSKITATHTLNKLPNGVADYIDVVNKVYVQRVGEIVLDGTHTFTHSSANSSAYYYGYTMVLSTNEFGMATSTSHGLCDKLQYQRNVNFPWTTDGDYIIIASNQLFIKLSKDKLNSNESVGSLTTYLASNPVTVLYELETPIYTPLTDEEIAQLPLSAHADGYVMLSSDQLMPSFEFRMKASNRYQVDMLETGYYYLNAPVGNVKLGTANVDVQQMPCIIKVDNVGTGDSGYRLGLSNELRESIIELTFGGYFNTSNGEVVTSSSDAYTPEYLSFKDYGLTTRFGFTSCEDTVGSGYGNIVLLYNEEKQQIGAYASETVLVNCDIPTDAKYFRVSIRTRNSDNPKAKIVNTFTTLAKLPSHRIPSPFTQGMKCATDFGCWEGIKVARPTIFRTVNTSNGWSIVESIGIENGMGIELNRIEYNNTIVEDEFDIATGKLIKRIGKTFIGYDEINSVSSMGTDGNTYYCYGGDINNYFPNWKKSGIFSVSNIKPSDGHRQLTPSSVEVEFFMSYIIGFNFKLFNGWSNKKKILLNEMKRTGGFTVLYELAVPEISYISLPTNQVKTVANTGLQCSRFSGCLDAQVKPSHLTYPVPSLVGNREYTVVHNRKNITGSTKPIELNLGGTVVQLNGASSKTLVKTPSTLAHNNLIFIGGESTVDHIMVLDGDWTNKPIEYFENMMGHDTDAIITIIGNGQIDDVEEQYLW